MTTSTEPAGLLIRAGTVYTADAGNQVVPNGSVLTVGRRIAAVGTAEDVDRALAALDPGLRGAVRTIDARGHMVLPGFVNPHWHELFALRLPFKAALRSPGDRDDSPGFMSLGGDPQQISTAFDSFQGQIDRLTPDEGEAIARYSLWTQLRSGVTTIGDVGSFNRTESMAAAVDALGLRAVLSTWAGDAVCARGESRHRRTHDTDQVLARAESLLRRCAEDRTGRLRARPTSIYITNMSDDLGKGFADLASRYGTTFATHAGALRNEVDVVRQYYGTTPVRRLNDLGLLTDRTTLVHCAFLDEDERALLLDADVHLNLSPAKYGFAGEGTLSHTRALPELRRAGLDVSLSTDGTAQPLGGMPEAMRAVWQSFNELAADSTEVRPTDALAMATRIAARGLGWDGDIGSLEAGKQADLLLVPTTDWRYLLNPRPLEAFLHLGASHDIDTVVVAGTVLLEGGRTLAADEEQLRADYLEALRSFSIRGLGIAPDLVDRTIDAAARRGTVQEG